MLERLMDRLREPTKRWKITTADLRSRSYWDQYQTAFEDMLNKTATQTAPWHVIPADDKHYARVASLQLIARQLGKHVDSEQVRLLSPEVIAAVIDEFGEDVLRIHLGEDFGESTD